MYGSCALLYFNFRAIRCSGGVPFYSAIYVLKGQNCQVTAYNYKQCVNHLISNKFLMCHSIQPCTACMLWACSCSCCTICLSLGILPFPCLERVNKPLIKLCRYGFIYLMRTSTSTPHTITLCLETSNKTTRILDTIIHPAHGEQIYYRMDLACADIVNITRRSESGRVIYLQATLHE